MTYLTLSYLTLPNLTLLDLTLLYLTCDLPYSILSNPSIPPSCPVVSLPYLILSCLKSKNLILFNICSAKQIWSVHFNKSILLGVDWSCHNCFNTLCIYIIVHYISIYSFYLHYILDFFIFLLFIILFIYIVCIVIFLIWFYW